MRLIKSSISPTTGSGSATLLPTNPQDLWHVYNLLRPGDTLRAPAVRKVALDTGGTSSSLSTANAPSKTSTTTKTVRTALAIRIKPGPNSIDYDAPTAELHVSGTICEENPHARLGAHHTLDLAPQRQFTLSKPGWDDAVAAGSGGEGWDAVARDTLREATSVAAQTASHAVVMQEGLAHVCALTEHQTVLLQRVEVSVPRKRAGAAGQGHERGVERFFEVLLATLRRHVDVGPAASAGEAAAAAAKTADGGSRVQAAPLVLASPGFTAAGFQRYMLDVAGRDGDKELAAYARERVVVAHSSSGHVHALSEAMKSPAVMKRLTDTRFARETRLMERFGELLRADDGRAWYGPREVERAVEKGAVGRGGGVLLVTDRLFRSVDVAERRRGVALVERVRGREGGEVRVLSSAHESGKRLEGLSGVGAILTFPLQELDEDESEDEEVDGQDHERDRNLR